jgi:hypothetical protein
MLMLLLLLSCCCCCCRLQALQQALDNPDFREFADKVWVASWSCRVAACNKVCLLHATLSAELTECLRHAAMLLQMLHVMKPEQYPAVNLP